MTRTETLKTLCALALAALAFYMFLHKPWLPYLCVFLLAVGLVDNPAARFIAGAWMRFAAIIGNISSRIVLGLVFYLLLAPLAFFYRFFGGNAAAYFTSDTRDTLFDDVPESVSLKDSFEKTW